MKKQLLATSLYLGLTLILILLFSVAIPSAVVFAADGNVAPNYVYDATDVTKDLEGADGL